MAHILVCPFARTTNLELPGVIWRDLCRLLRSYGLPVYLMAYTGQRMDFCAFTESEILSELDNNGKIEYLAKATLLVGVPNIWLEMAAAHKTPTIMFYPADIKPDLWMPYQWDKLVRVATCKQGMVSPVVLTAVRQAIMLL